GSDELCPHNGGGLFAVSRARLLQFVRQVVQREPVLSEGAVNPLGVGFEHDVLDFKLSHELDLTDEILLVSVDLRVRRELRRNRLWRWVRKDAMSVSGRNHELLDREEPAGANMIPAGVTAWQPPHRPSCRLLANLRGRCMHLI